MKVIIFVSKRFPTLGIHKYSDWSDEAAKVIYDLLTQAIVSSEFEITEVVSCNGCFGERYAEENNLPLRLITNLREMCCYADASILILCDGSKGQEELVEMMKVAKKPFFVVIIG